MLFYSLHNLKKYYSYGANEFYCEHVLIMITLWKPCPVDMKKNEQFDKKT